MSGQKTADSIFLSKTTVYFFHKLRNSKRKKIPEAWKLEDACYSDPFEIGNLFLKFKSGCI